MTFVPVRAPSHRLSRADVRIAGALSGGLLAGLFASQVGVDPLVPFLTGSALAGLLVFSLPSFLERRETRRLEAQVGSMLRLLSVRLSFEPFEEALSQAALQSPRPHPALARLAHDVRSGVAPLSALRRFGASSPSIAIKKAAMQLSFAYRQGESSGLSSLADEFSHLHAAALQRFAGRTAFASVWFEALGALLPLLLSAYVLVGASFLDFTFSPALPFWLLAVVFPLANAVLVAYVWLDAPEDLA